MKAGIWLGVGGLVLAGWSACASAANEPDQAALRAELDSARQALRESSQRVAELSRQLGEHSAATRSFTFFGEQRPVLGVVLGESDGEVGARIVAVTPESAAQTAGLRSGDRLVAVDGQRIVQSGSQGLDAARAALADLEEGQTLRLEVIRDGRLMQLQAAPKALGEMHFEFSDGWAPRLVMPEIDLNLGGEFSAELINEQVRRALEQAGVADEKTLERMEKALERSMAERERLVLREQGRIEREVERAQRDATREAARAEREATRAARDALRAQRDAERIELRMSHDGPGMARFEMSTDDSALSLSALNADLGRYFGVEQGVLVLSARGSDYAQLKSGDVIQRIGGEVVDGPRAAWQRLRDGDPGEPRKLSVWRERESVSVIVTVPQRRFAPLPPAPPAPPKAPSAPPPPPAPVAPVPPAPPPPPAPRLSSDQIN